MSQIQSLLSARLFLVPQLVDGHIYFISNLSGHMSLYRMREGGSVPQPLLPPHIALQNPAQMEGYLFAVFPKLGRVLVMIDQDGDENYQPAFIPLTGDFPQPALPALPEGFKFNLLSVDTAGNVAYFWAQSLGEPINRAYRAHLDSGEVVMLYESEFGGLPMASTPDYAKTVLVEAFGPGDNILLLKDGHDGPVTSLFGVRPEFREPGREYPPSGINDGYFVDDGKALLVTTVLFSDTYGLGLLSLDAPEGMRPVTIRGEQHSGLGELERLQHIGGERYALQYNIDGCSWLYEGRFDVQSETMTLEHVVCGQGALSGGVLKGHYYDRGSDRYVLSFTTAANPTQIYTVGGAHREELVQHTDERVLGIPSGVLSEGEDASFISYDGLRVSARLYLPDGSLGFSPPYPLVYYLHGGPQSQERPDFAWFSMPLIQHLTLNGFAVFVPNARGSTGYGFTYSKHVIRDWGGADRLDHVHAMTEVLPKDGRIDVSRAGVVGRSYGGYMTLMLAGRHPELWSAAVDMFGPYDLLTFADRVPETWKPFMKYLVGDPETEQDFLRERSPRTYIHQLACPMLVIQGANDPRVWEQESRELVEELRGMGKDVDYLLFEDEGHDVLKYENRVRCYEAITGFFGEHLRPGS